MIKARWAGHALRALHAGLSWAGACCALGLPSAERPHHWTFGCMYSPFGAFMREGLFGLPGAAQPCTTRVHLGVFRRRWPATGLLLLFYIAWEMPRRRRRGRWHARRGSTTTTCTPAALPPGRRGACMRRGGRAISSSCPGGLAAAFLASVSPLWLQFQVRWAARDVARVGLLPCKRFLC